MSENETRQEWIRVKADALPEIYHKVLEMKTALRSGAVTSVSDAARQWGVSRSAYYKYRDAVLPCLEEETTLTVGLLLQDSPGVLSGVLAVLAEASANVLTVDQQPPLGGVAAITIRAGTDKMTEPIDRLVERLGQVPGVRRITDIRRGR